MTEPTNHLLLLAPDVLLTLGEEHSVIQRDARYRLKNESGIRVQD
ncbi:MAG TPA: hypothetical protein VFP64_18790 [Pyrinomonadaceae bacterium]|nr:hypothetical protein [Pyrinomonadaceae bacterium]